MSENKMNVMDLPDGGSLQKGDTVLVIRDNGDGTQTAVRTDAGTATSGIVDSEGNLTVKGFLSVKGDTSLRGNVVVSDTESSRGSVSTEKLYANTIDAYDDALYINNVESINSTGNQEFRLPPTSGTLTTSEATDTKLATKIDKGSLATINGSTLEDGGNITLDLSLFKLVTALPTTDIDETKIYLVKSTQSETGNVYTEYIYVSGSWEKLGEYQSKVDLSNYVTTDTAQTIGAKKTFHTAPTMAGLFINTGDSTMKFYTGRTTDGLNDGSICMQTDIDQEDGETSTKGYSGLYPSRCNICLQPKGGQVYIGEAPTSPTSAYKLNVKGAALFDGGAVTASSFVKSGGTASQLLLANGGTQDLYSINAASVQGYKLLLDFPYKSTLGVFTNDTGNVWYLHLHCLSWTTFPGVFALFGHGANPRSYAFIHGGTAGDADVFGWQSSCDGRVITGICSTTTRDGKCHIYLEIYARMTEVTVYNASINWSCEKLDSCDVTFEDAGGFWFGNKAPLTSTDIGTLTETEIASVLV